MAWHIFMLLYIDERRVFTSQPSRSNFSFILHVLYVNILILFYFFNSVIIFVILISFYLKPKVGVFPLHYIIYNHMFRNLSRLWQIHSLYNFSCQSIKSTLQLFSHGFYLLASQAPEMLTRCFSRKIYILQKVVQVGDIEQ